MHSEQGARKMPILTTRAVSAEMLLLASQLHKARIHARAVEGQQNEMLQDCM